MEAMHEIKSSRDITKVLDEFYKKEDVAGAGEFLESCLKRLREEKNTALELTVLSELMGFYRRNGNGTAAREVCLRGIELLEKGSVPDSLSKAAIWINAATTLCSCRSVDEDIEYFERAREIYLRLLRANDPLWASYYNNLATALESKNRLAEARENYLKALEIASRTYQPCSVAVTAVNLACLASKAGDEGETDKYVGTAWDALERERDRGEKYAFACRKCAEAMDLLGYFYYAARLNERADKIYEGA